MSKEGYIKGFVKAASAKGIDPEALARYALSQKTAADDSGKGNGIWSSVLNAINTAKEKYRELPTGVKDILSAGTGAAVGTGLGAAIGGKKGLVPGAILGGIGGGALGRVSPEQWKALADYFAKSNKKPKPVDPKEPENPTMG